MDSVVVIVREIVALSQLAIGHDNPYIQVCTTFWHEPEHNLCGSMSCSVGSRFERTQGGDWWPSDKWDSRPVEHIQLTDLVDVWDSTLQSYQSVEIDNLCFVSKRSGRGIDNSWQRIQLKPLSHHTQHIWTESFYELQPKCLLVEIHLDHRPSLHRLAEPARRKSTTHSSGSIKKYRTKWHGLAEVTYQAILVGRDSILWNNGTPTFDRLRLATAENAHVHLWLLDHGSDDLVVIYCDHVPRWTLVWQYGARKPRLRGIPIA